MEGINAFMPYNLSRSLALSLLLIYQNRQDARLQKMTREKRVCVHVCACVCVCVPGTIMAHKLVTTAAELCDKYGLPNEVSSFLFIFSSFSLHPPFFFWH